MNRFALIAITGCLSLVLTACGEQKNSKPVPTEVTNEQGVAPAAQPAEVAPQQPAEVAPQQPAEVAPQQPAEVAPQ